MLVERAAIREYSEQLGLKAEVAIAKDLDIPDSINEKFNFHWMDVTLPSKEKVQLILVLTERNVTPTVMELKADLDVISKKVGRIAVFGCSGIRPAQRRNLLEQNVNFIEPGRHYFIPEMMLAMVDEARKRREAPEKVKALTPAAQAVLLANLYVKPKEDFPGLKTRMTQRDLLCGLDYSRPAINKATDELVAAGVLQKLDDRPYNPEYSFVGDKEEVLAKAWPLLSSPVKRTVMVSIELKPSMQPRISWAGASGLAEHIGLDHPELPVFCMSLKDFNAAKTDDDSWITTDPAQAKAFLQVWSYASLGQQPQEPDELSLLLSLKGTPEMPDYSGVSTLTGHLQWFRPEEI
ncbi:hypothetical protein HNP46_000449 [Pseudomonas nitritireducens]|uniref:Uncharacterized protein n=1 Tax=Pseudomonas nitroreducens TaxID=46680 RepID=A0A7W7NYE7_PSENT|nr:hypothetical protein [Pseudomonas nitritireducens]MBB4861638.1 hypothetical protein [Pseudomonas nitritireducens]